MTIPWYHFMRFRWCLWQSWLHWCPSTNLQIPFDDDSTDTLGQFREYLLTIPRIPFDDSADTLLCSILPFSWSAATMVFSDYEKQRNLYYRHLRRATRKSLLVFDLERMQSHEGRCSEVSLSKKKRFKMVLHQYATPSVNLFTGMHKQLAHRNKLANRKSSSDNYIHMADSAIKIENGRKKVA